MTFVSLMIGFVVALVLWLRDVLLGRLRGPCAVPLRARRMLRPLLDLGVPVDARAGRQNAVRATHVALAVLHSPLPRSRTLSLFRRHADRPTTSPGRAQNSLR